jgi:hypothetical protein
MFSFFRQKPRPREICFHDDDYCRQQLLPRDAAAFADAELTRIREFADAHRAPGGFGWTDVYARREAPVELRKLNIKKEQFAEIVTPFLPSFDVVYTGYSSHRKQCKRTAAWGRSERCALFVDWVDASVVSNAWTEFFDDDEASIIAATQAIAALGSRHPLIYVDWAWGYTCDASDEEAFASRLRAKLKRVADNTSSFTQA